MRYKALFALALTCAPAFAQMDFSGEWATVQDEDNTGNPYLGEWVGIPMSEAGKLRAAAWSASIQTLPEWQCRPHGATYISRGPSQLRISKEVDPISRTITAFHVEWLRSIDNPIFMDGRPHPSPNAAHTWGGFATGEWIGDTLKVTVTHLKEDYLRRNGVPVSDLATMTEYLMRRGDILTWVTIVYDPVYLTEPVIRSSEYRLALNQQIPPYPCTVIEEVDRPNGVVPSYLPGANPSMNDFGKKYDIPAEAALGGAESMYPELERKIIAAKESGSEEMTKLLSLALLATTAFAQTSPNPDIELLHIRKNLYLLTGAGGNITLSIGPDGIFMVDSGLANMSDKVLAAINKLSQQLNTAGQPDIAVPPPKPIRYIANTHMHPDHTGGNEKISKAGKTFTGGNVTGDLPDATEGAAILAHENVLARLSAQKPALPYSALPTETYSKDVMKLSHFMNGEAIQLIHLRNAHTDGDSIVYFRGSDVIATGDIFVMTGYPFIDMEHGGTLQGIIDGLNHVLDLSISEFRTEGGTMIVPGHGRLCDTADLAYYRDMVTIIRDRVQNDIKKGMSLAQVKDSKPTRDWDPRFGATTGFWTTDMFVEAAYKSLTAPAAKK